LFPETDSEENISHNTRSKTQQQNNQFTKSQSGKLTREMKQLDGFFNPELYGELTTPNNDQDTVQQIETVDDVVTDPPTEQRDRALMMISIQPLSVSEVKMIDIEPISYINNATTTINSSGSNNPFNVKDHQLKDILHTSTTYE
jgi:hypothetical protein